MPSGLFQLSYLERSITKKKEAFFFFLLSPRLIKNPVYNRNSADPDQTPRYEEFDLGLHFLLMSLSWATRHNRLTPEKLDKYTGYPVTFLINDGKQCIS